jgi:hypothetical protein
MSPGAFSKSYQRRGHTHFFLDDQNPANPRKIQDIYLLNGWDEHALSPVSVW